MQLAFFKNKKKQIRDYAGKIVKRFNNKVFTNNKVGNWAYNLYKKINNNRYNNLEKYLNKKIALVSGISGLILISSIVPLLSFLSLPLLIGNIAIGGYSIAIGLITYYKKEKNKLKSVDKEPVLENKDNNDIKTDIEEESERILPKKEFSKFSNYGNLGMYGVLKRDNLKYLDAYNIVRKTDDEDLKMEAYAKLAGSFGKSNKKKSETKKKLNSYSMMLKRLSELGKKIHEGLSTKEDNVEYISLLYILGNDIDDIEDYISDEYDRYIEDCKRFYKIN